MTIAMNRAVSFARRTSALALCLSAVTIGCSGSIQDDTASQGQAITDGTAISASQTGHVRIRVGSGEWFSGTLVRNHWILTKKSGLGVDPTQVTIQMGPISGAAGDQQRTAAQILPHPTHDVALIRVAWPFSVNNAQVGLVLPLGADPHPTADLLCYGYGNGGLVSGTFGMTNDTAPVYQLNNTGGGAYPARLSSGDEGGPCFRAGNLVGVITSSGSAAAFVLGIDAIRDWILTSVVEPFGQSAFPVAEAVRSPFATHVFQVALVNSDEWTIRTKANLIGEWTGWVDTLPSMRVKPLTSAVSAVAWDSSRIDVFYVAPHGGLGQLAWSDSVGAWQTNTGFGTAVQVEETAVGSVGPNRLNVIVGDSTGHLKEMRWNGSGWSGFIDGPFSALTLVRPVVFSSPGRVDLIAWGVGNVLHHTQFTEATGWSALTAVAVASSEASMASLAPGRLDVFYRVGTELRTRYRDASGNWSTPVVAPGAVINGKPVAVTRRYVTGQIDVFMGNSANDLWVSSLTTAGWGPFAKVAQNFSTGSSGLAGLNLPDGVGIVGGAKYTVY